jgi:hypothetical protein
MPNGPAGLNAAEAARRRQQEEEAMAVYSPGDLQDWEFKIVRTARALFAKPEELNKLIQEEARAGWVMLEKFDDHRIRFKRPIRAREDDRLLPPGVDPYRTQVGPSPLLYALLIVGLASLAACGLAAVIIGFFVYVTLSH